MWRAWIARPNETSQTSVLLNGVPGRWIQCRRGLRQGDPLSPFLFNIVADVLQQLLLQASRDGLLLHPLVDDLPCPILQYADDTLIIIRAIPQHVTNLKNILDSFTAATGLAINFHKSTFVPIKTDPESASNMAALFGCAVSSFPQTYLGLPLSTHKLHMADFNPILTKSDMRLSGWRGRSLPIGGRLLLVNSVLTAMLAHTMSAGLLLAGVIEAIDKRHHAFLWTGEEVCHGGHCKVAWHEVCTPKNLGGLGVLSIAAQNSAILSKFLSKLHSDSSAPWACWFRRRYGWSAAHDMGDRHYLDTPVWKDIVAGLESFRSISKVTVGDGSSTSFWFGRWLGSTPLSERFPDLFSHSVRINVCVSYILNSGIQGNLGPRLSNAAMADLLTLSHDLSSVVLHSDEPDQRVGHLSNNALSNKCFYANSFRHLQVDVLADKVWGNAVR